MLRAHRIETAPQGRRSHRSVCLGRAGSRASGGAIEVRVVLEGAANVITELVVNAGGHDLPGDSSALPALFVGKDAPKALAVTHREIAHKLGGLPESKMYCSVLVHEALRAAVAGVCAEQTAEGQGCQAGVACRCFTVAEDMIQRTIRANGLTSVEQVTCYTRAGAGCGLCAANLASILSGATSLSETSQSSPDPDPDPTPDAMENGY
jgi:NifU-like protein